MGIMHVDYICYVTGSITGLNFVVRYATCSEIMMYMQTTNKLIDQSDVGPKQSAQYLRIPLTDVFNEKL